MAKNVTHDELTQAIRNVAYDTTVKAGELEIEDRKELLKADAQIIDCYIKITQSDHDRELAINRLILEEAKKDKDVECEKIRNHMPIEKILVELFKIAAPIITVKMSIDAHREEFDIAGKFEETGRYMSNIMRQTGFFPVRR